jgi:hypothetical protein
MTPIRQTTVLAMALASLGAACAPPVTVRTSESPTADFAAYYTFRVLPPPDRRAGAPALPAQDPMLNNSITNQELRQDLVRALEGRGYEPNRQGPDFLVAYYAGTKEKFDTTYWVPGPWRYTYWGFRDRWAWPYYGWAPAVAQVEEHTEGSVVVDVIDAKTHQLAWRGQGVAQVADDPQQYAKDLARAVDDIMKKYPAARTTVSSTR